MVSYLDVWFLLHRMRAQLSVTRKYAPNTAQTIRKTLRAHISNIVPRIGKTHICGAIIYLVTILLTNVSSHSELAWEKTWNFEC